MRATRRERLALVEVLAVVALVAGIWVGTFTQRSGDEGTMMEAGRDTRAEVAIDKEVR